MSTFPHNPAALISLSVELASRRLFVYATGPRWGEDFSEPHPHRGVVIERLSFNLKGMLKRL